MPHIKANDISVYYEILGEGEPIVLVGGFSNDHTIWAEVAKQLSVDHQVILLDNRGAGQTDVPVGPYSIEQMATDVAALCEKLGIKRANFVGNSMGGFILQSLAVKYSNLVKSMVISNSTSSAHCVFQYFINAQLQLLKANAPLASLVYASSSWAFSYRFLSQPQVLDQLIQITLSNPYPFTIPGFEGQYAALDCFDSSQWVHTINVPTLVLSGDQDLIFSEASVKSLAEKIPQAEYYCFKDCGHLPLVEFPQKFSNLVKAFISKTV